MNYLQGDGPKTKSTVCAFEAVKQKVWRMPIIHVSATVLFKKPLEASRGLTDTFQSSGR